MLPQQPGTRTLCVFYCPTRFEQIRVRQETTILRLSTPRQGNARICQLLLDHGADPNMQTDPQGYSPLHSAAWGGHVEAVQVLLECDARTDLHNYRGEIPLKTARRQKRTAVVELLKGRMPGKSWWRFW